MIKGSIVAIVTPMHQDGSLDLDAMSRLVKWHIEEGTDAIVAVGTTGESATLDVDEHCEVISHVVADVDGKIPVIAGTGANSTSEAIELTRAAKKAGADACLLVTPITTSPISAAWWNITGKLPTRWIFRRSSITYREGRPVTCCRKPFIPCRQKPI